LEQQTWVSLLGMAGFALALAGYLRNVLRDLSTDLRAEISGCRSELKDEIATTRVELKDEITITRTELKADIARLDGRLTTIEQRTYDLSTRLPPAPAQSP